jgi:cell division protein FtsA
MTKNKMVAALDIGTSKVVVLIGEIVRGKSLQIVGFAQVPCTGVCKGDIVDFKAVSNSVHKALDMAEKNAKAKVDYVYLSLSGTHIYGFLNTGVVTVTAADNRVSQADIQRVDENAKAKQLATDRVYIHHIRQAYLLDDKKVANPYMMHGERLQASFWSICGNAKKIRDCIHIVNGFGLKVENVVLASVAAGRVVTTESERMHGVAVLDIGCGTSDFILYKDGYALRTGIIPVGGDHLTNDLSLGLRVHLDCAEGIKKDYGKAFIDSFDKQEPLTCQDGGLLKQRSIPKEAVYQILNARVLELGQIVHQSLQAWMKPALLPAGVVITGGSSRLRGIETVLSQALGVGVRVGHNPSWASERLQAPEYSTVLGLLQAALSDMGVEELGPKAGDLTFLAKVRRLFRPN